MKSLETKVPPLIVFAIAAIAMIVLSKFASVFAILIPGQKYLFPIILAIGVAIVTIAIIAFRRHQTTVNPMQPSASSYLVTTGVFSLSRNPMYLGMLMVLTGLAVFLSNLAAFVMLPLFVAYMTRFQIKPEENAMLGNYQQQYAEYMTKVRRWI